VDAGLTRALVLAATVPLLLSGCYYGHLAHGQYELVSKRTPIEKLLRRPATSPALRDRLTKALEARRFASRELKLPDNGSYTTYADLGRPFAVWNVFATPELSLQPQEWCYPVFGCQSYRGYYELERGEELAAQLRAEGMDVFVAGVGAYSTLGWFDDPILNTMRGADDELAATIFHELAHQVEFAAGDTAFNESFATFVEQEGLRRYLKEQPELAQAAERRRQRREQVAALMMRSRARLVEIYASAEPNGEKRQRKLREFERLRQEYAELRAGWGDDRGYDAWFKGELNNARLLPFGLYNRWVPAFAALFRRQQGDWVAFYREVGELGNLDKAEREKRLEQLLLP